MRKIKINGAKPLGGSFTVNGSKNAALPLVFASLACHGVSELSNFPNIGDTETALELISDLGAVVKREGKSVYIDTRNLTYAPPRAELTRKIRASTYLIGACLSRFGRIDISGFGGCDFSDRPIDLHVYAAEALGAKSQGSCLTASRLLGNRVNLPKPSVGATVNTLIIAAGAEGTTEIYGAAKEPHVMCLIDFLRTMGAEIDVSDKCIKVVGKDLTSGSAYVIGDMVEAATYLLAGAVTGGEVTAVGLDTQTLYPLFGLLSDMGADIKLCATKAKVGARGQLKYAKATAKPYPGLPTDIQPMLAPIFAANSGGAIRDLVFPDRLGYLDVLSGFGISSYRCGKSAVVLPSRIHNARVSAPDLRGGAACILAALAANGESEISSSQIILRGYEAPDKLLRSLGGKIKIL